MFTGMEYTENHARIRERMPLIMKHRDPNQSIAATYMNIGTDINFAAITRGLIDHITSTPQVRLHLKHHVSDLSKQPSGQRKVTVHDQITGATNEIHTKFVFI